MDTQLKLHINVTNVLLLFLGAWKALLWSWKLKIWVEMEKN